MLQSFVPKTNSNGHSRLPLQFRKGRKRQAKRVAIIHFTTRTTDGVGLQVEENKRILRKLGWQVIECSSDVPLTEKDCFYLKELDFRAPEVIDLKDRIFSKKFKGEHEEELLIRLLIEQVRVIHGKLLELINQYQPPAINVRNIMSLPIHPAATMAMAAVIREYPEIFFVTQHHDFVDEGRKEQYSTPYPKIREFLKQSLLYSAPNVRHAVINSLAQKY